jgi:transposase
VTPEGFPLSYEVFEGSRADVTTLEEALEAVERKYGRARRMWVFDRGIVSEENLQSLRRRGASYLEGTPRAQLKAHERRLLEGQWQSISSEVEVQLIPQDNNETYVLARSRTRAQKESGIRSHFVRGLMRDLIRCAECFATAGSKIPQSFFCIWDDSKSVTIKLGLTSKSASKTYA